MKKYIILTAILVFGSLSIFAACGVPTTLANSSIPCVSGLDSNPANISARVWVPGLNNPTDGAGTDSDGIPAVDTGCVFSGAWVLGDWAACAGGNPGEYYILTDWWTPAYDGCPASGAVRAALLAYDTSGRYILQSRLQTEDWTNWDAIGTSVADIPRFDNLTGGSAVRTGATTADITFPAIPASVYNGAYNGAAPASPIATHYKVYAWQAADGNGPGPGQNSISSGWIECGGGATYPITQTTISGITIPAQVAGQGIVFSRSLVFEGTELPFVSESLLPLTGEPLSAGVIDSVSAKASGLNTVVTWKSSDESRVTSYQVYWAPNASSQFAPVGSVVTPTGSNSTYSQSVRIPAQGSFVVKVGANLLDGSVEYSSVASVTPSVVIKDRTRVVPN